MTYVLERNQDEYERLHAAGHRQARFEAVDVGDYAGGPFGLVFARLLVLYVDDPAATLRRLWELVAPGGHLVLMEHARHGERRAVWPLMIGTWRCK